MSTVFQEVWQLATTKMQLNKNVILNFLTRAYKSDIVWTPGERETLEAIVRVIANNPEAIKQLASIKVSSSNRQVKVSTLLTTWVRDNYQDGTDHAKFFAMVVDSLEGQLAEKESVSKTLVEVKDTTVWTGLHGVMLIAGFLVGLVMLSVASKKSHGVILTTMTEYGAKLAKRVKDHDGLIHFLRTIGRKFDESSLQLKQTRALLLNSIERRKYGDTIEKSGRSRSSTSNESISQLSTALAKQCLSHIQLLTTLGKKKMLLGEIEKAIKEHRVLLTKNEELCKTMAVKYFKGSMVFPLDTQGIQILDSGMEKLARRASEDARAIEHLLKLLSGTYVADTLDLSIKKMMQQFEESTYISEEFARIVNRNMLYFFDGQVPPTPIYRYRTRTRVPTYVTPFYSAQESLKLSSTTSK